MQFGERGVTFDVVSDEVELLAFEAEDDALTARTAAVEVVGLNDGCGLAHKAMSMSNISAVSSPRAPVWLLLAAMKLSRVSAASRVTVSLR